MLVEAGQIGAFAGRAFLELPATLRDSAEMMRQVALLITGSAIVLWAMQFTFGLTCGNESGSMRIGEVIDAMESLGISPMRYLVGTRLLANILVSAPIFIVGLVLFYLGEVFVILFQIGEISQGAWETVHWAFTDLPSIFFSYLKTLVMWISIVIAAMNYGSTPRAARSGWVRRP